MSIDPITRDDSLPLLDASCARSERASVAALRVHSIFGVMPRETGAPSNAETRVSSERLGVTGSPAFAGDDTAKGIKRQKRNTRAERSGSRAASAAIWLGCLLVSAIPFATSASAHVKWFVTCNAADEPLPLQAVFTPTFWLFSALFATVLYAGCVIEETKLGGALSGLLDRWTEPLHKRSDGLLRGVAAVSFALLWADGGVILTPELKGNSIWLSAIQVLIPIYLIARATLPAAAAGILVLYGYGAATYGLFHMLDYTVFLGLAAYFALSLSRNERLRSFRFACLRWTVALSLMWPAMEKFVYPAWIVPILTEHPELTLGFDVATVITGAGVVEFGLAFALFWTPMVRRFAAAGLAMLLFAATFDFGKMDGIGHLMLIALLVLVLADPGRKRACCRPLVAPLVGGALLLAVICLYAGTHTFYYGSSAATLAPLANGTALLLLAAGFLCLPSLSRGFRRRLLLWLIKHDEGGDALALQRLRGLSLVRPVMGSDRVVPLRAHV